MARGRLRPKRIGKPAGAFSDGYDRSQALAAWSTCVRCVPRRRIRRTIRRASGGALRRPSGPAVPAGAPAGGSGEDARDLVQETFLRAARSPRLSAGRRLARRGLARPRPHQHLPRSLAPGCGPPVPSALTRRLHASTHPESALIAKSLVWQALDQLPPRRRAILILYELEGTQIPAIARLLGVTAVTVRWHLSVGRREMARALTASPSGERT